MNDLLGVALRVDIVVDLAEDRVAALIAALGDDFYADADALRRAVRHRANVNLIHHGSGVKIDLFIAGSPLEMRQLERRRRAHVGGASDRFVYMHSPEDILLQKLEWFRRGGGTSDRQWRDVLSILIVQRGRLDEAYLRTVAAECGLSDLLDRARRDAAEP